MATVTRVELGPHDHGRRISREEFETAERAHGYRFEIIDGRVYVSPIPNHPHDLVTNWLFGTLFGFSHRRPDVINYVSFGPRVFVHGRPETTCPEPDIAAYADYPYHLPVSERRWEDLNPVLVVEIVSESDPKKDLERNVRLYLEVPSVREYWIVDPRPDADHPTLIVYRRRGSRWQKPIVVPAGETYDSPKLLPGFSLVVDPRVRS